MLPIISYLILLFFLFLAPPGGWYLMIVCGQAAHIWVCRTTTVSIFQHGVFSNKITNIGVVIALLLGCFVTYCPGKATAPILYSVLFYFLAKPFPQSFIFYLLIFLRFLLFLHLGLQTIVQSANPDSLLILYASLFVSFALW